MTTIMVPTRPAKRLKTFNPAQQQQQQQQPSVAVVPDTETFSPSSSNTMTTTTRTTTMTTTSIMMMIPFSILVDHILPCLHSEERHTVASLHPELYRQCQLNLPPWPHISYPNLCAPQQVQSVAISSPWRRRRRNNVSTSADTSGTTCDDGVWVACGCKDGTIQLLWQSSSSSSSSSSTTNQHHQHHHRHILRHTRPHRNNDPVFHVIFNPTRPYQLVSASWGRDRRPDEIYVWDLRYNPPHVAALGPIVAVEGPTFPIIFSPHGHYLATAGYHLHIWKMKDDDDMDDDDEEEDDYSMEQWNGTTVTRVFSWVGAGAGSETTTHRNGSTRTTTTTRTSGDDGGTNGGEYDNYSDDDEDYNDDDNDEEYDEDDALVDSHPEYTSLSFSPEKEGSRYLATSCAWETGVRLWDLQSKSSSSTTTSSSSSSMGEEYPDGEPLSQRLTSQFPIDQVAFSPTSTTRITTTTTTTTCTKQSQQQEEYILATAGPDYCIRIWTIPHGTCERVIENYGIRISTLAFHPNGTVLMAGNVETSLLFWNVEKGTLVNGLSCLSQEVKAASWSSSSSSSSSLSTAVSSSRISKKTMTEEQVAQQQEEAPVVPFVTASRNGTIRLWNICLTRQRLEEARQCVTKFLSTTAATIANTTTTGRPIGERAFISSTSSKKYS